MRKVLDFRKRPLACTGLRDTNEYKAFIKTALKYADYFCMSATGMFYEDFLKSKWDFLSDSIMDYEYTTETAVTKSSETFLLLYLKIDHITSKWLMSKKNIYDFMDAQISERDKNYCWLYDLCFIKDRAIVFCSCTHEEFCFVSQELLDLQPELYHTCLR